jgi:hypothetical protein
MAQTKLQYVTWKPNENIDIGTSIPFAQGEEYLKYKSKTTERLQSRSRMLSGSNGFNGFNKKTNQELVEGFVGMVGPSAATKKTDKEIKELEDYEKVYNKKLSAYALAHKNLMDTTQTFVSVTGSQKEGHSYGNSNVQLNGTDGNTYKGYVSSRGFFKPYSSDEVFSATAGKNGCGSQVVANISGTYPIQDLNQGDVIESKPEMFYLKNSPMISGQGCGNEATNIHVTHALDLPIAYSLAKISCGKLSDMTAQNDITGDIATLQNCAIRASDLGAKYFGVSVENPPKCYISYSAPSEATPAAEMIDWIFPNYSVTQSYLDTNNISIAQMACGLLADGQIGFGAWTTLSDPNASDTFPNYGNWNNLLKAYTLEKSTNTPWNANINGSNFQCNSITGGSMNSSSTTYGCQGQDCINGKNGKHTISDCVKGDGSIEKKDVQLGNWDICVDQFEQVYRDSHNPKPEPTPSSCDDTGCKLQQFTFPLTNNVTGGTSQGAEQTGGNYPTVNGVDDTNKCWSNISAAAKCSGTFKQSHYTDLPCTKVDDIYCDCSALTSEQCETTDGCSEASVNSAGFVTIENDARSTGLGYTINSRCAPPVHVSFKCGDKIMSGKLDKEGANMYTGGNTCSSDTNNICNPDTINFDCSDYNKLCGGALTLSDDGTITITNGNGDTTWSYSPDSSAGDTSTYTIVENPDFAASQGKTKSNSLRAGLDMLLIGEFIGSPKGKYFIRMENYGGDHVSTSDAAATTGASQLYDPGNCGIVGSKAGCLMPASGEQCSGTFKQSHYSNLTCANNEDGLCDCSALTSEQCGSTDGCTISGNDTTENFGLVLYKNISLCSQTSTGLNAIEPTSIVVYQISKIPDDGKWEGIDNLNKVGLIGDDTKMHEYPSNLIKPGENFYSMGAYDTPDNTVQTFSGDYDASGCKNLCLDNDSCAGFVIDNDKNCVLKNSNMFPSSLRVPKPNTHYQMYIRSKAVNNSLSCPKEVEQSSALQWELYPIGDKMNMKTLCELGLASEAERAELSKANDELMQMKSDMSSKLENLNKEDIKLGSSLGENIDKLNNDMKEYTTVKKKSLNMIKQVENIDGKHSDSELDMVSKNTTYMMWSILAITFVIGGIKATRH